MFLNKTDETSANVNAMERDQAPPLKKTGLGMALRVTPTATLSLDSIFRLHLIVRFRLRKSRHSLYLRLLISPYLSVIRHLKLLAGQSWILVNPRPYFQNTKQTNTSLVVKRFMY